MNKLKSKRGKLKFCSKMFKIRRMKLQIIKLLFKTFQQNCNKIIKFIKFYIIKIKDLNWTQVIVQRTKIKFLRKNCLIKKYIM